MLELGEMLQPHLAGTSLWPLMRQAGIVRAVGTFYQPDRLEYGEQPWDFLPMLRLKQQYNDNGFQLDVIEDRPPMELTKRGLPGRDEEIDHVITLIENMGRLEVPVWCYAWMADFGWLRTSTTIPARGGSTVSGFNLDLMRDAPPTPQGSLSEETLWSSLKYFLDCVLPAAERAGVTLAMHPDDPPRSPIRAVGRIMSSIEGFDRLLSLNPSARNAITFCQGNFRLMTDDLPAAIHHFGRQGKIAFVHMRDVAGTRDNFVETWHDAGPTDMVACFNAYREIGFDGVMRSDHVPSLIGEEDLIAGYGTLGRLFAVGYLRGLQQAAFH
ncbi:mannonate dehydratase [Tessaracoccus antarcticus]|uniref:mannonate dehydratase n=1 Tax=Tessaracoccus antarcticus TaxID=2479848 RepID=A0A3M0G5B7_9ACTN|nr:mannonate dehydratase [Tessaracoccus antarcticus]RMB60231.1 mannonate dehydratase [Tessaracoccus antarcticus]